MQKNFFPWKDNYSLGIEEIDNQHKKLFLLINQLYTSFIEKKSDEVLNEILKELLDYARYHFDTEEKFLNEINYPKIKEHTAIHEDFTSKAVEFRHSFRKGSIITSSVMNFLRKWVSDHILIADRDYMNHLK
jgi:hemerythrin